MISCIAQPRACKGSPRKTVLRPVQTSRRLRPDHRNCPARHSAPTATRKAPLSRPSNAPSGFATADRARDGGAPSGRCCRTRFDWSHADRNTRRPTREGRSLRWICPRPRSDRSHPAESKCSPTRPEYASAHRQTRWFLWEDPPDPRQARPGLCRCHWLSRPRFKRLQQRPKRFGVCLVAFPMQIVEIKVDAMRLRKLAQSVVIAAHSRGPSLSTKALTECAGTRMWSPSTGVASWRAFEGFDLAHPFVGWGVRHEQIKVVIRPVEGKQHFVAARLARNAFGIAAQVKTQA